MIRTGLVSITFRKLAPAQIIALVRQAQMAGIEWGGDVHVPHGDLGRAEDVRDRTADAGLVVSAYGAYYRVGSSDAGGLDFARVLETAVVLGAPVIRVWAGAVGSAVASPADWARVVCDARRIGDLATASGKTIACEFHGGSLTDTAESADRLLAEINHPAVGTFWQPPNGATVESSLAGLKLLLPRIRNVHVFHWWPSHQERHALAVGADRWRQYLSVLQGSGRDHFASLEYVAGDAPESFLQDAQVLKAWCGSRDR